MSKEGYEATDPDPNHKLLDADYPFFKFHDDVTGSVTFTAGDTHKSVDFTHDLGYVPAFISYWKDQNSRLHFIPGLPYPFGFEGSGIDTAYAYAYADNTKIRCGVQIAAGAYNQYSGSAYDFWSTKDPLHDSCTRVGNDGGDSNGAFRFTSINIPQGSTISSAVLGFYIGVKGAGTGDLKAKIYGIDEDNTSDFGSSPMGRTQTTNYDESSWSLPAQGQYSNHNVTSIVQEIIGRNGWSTGNALGFLLFNNGSPDNVWVFDGDVEGSPSSTLTISYGGNTTVYFRTIIFKDKIA